MGEQSAGGFNPLVPRLVLEKADRVLFVTHVALGDFVYLQSCFKVFKDMFPHLKIDLWVDEAKPSKTLLDWLRGSGLFHTIYSRPAWAFVRNKSLWLVKKKNYPLIVSLCQMHTRYYARLARRMSKRGFIAGVISSKKSSKKLSVLDAQLNCGCDSKTKDAHVSDLFKQWFEKLFGLEITFSNQKPFVLIPREWICYAKLRFIKWGIAPKEKRYEKVFFVNAFAKNAFRCWPIDRLLSLLRRLQQTDGFVDSYFIINVEPRFYNDIKKFLSNYCLHRIFLFTAHENFFQLPSIMSLCDYVISVETSIVHLASALQIPVVALMRRKSPEWAPFYKEKSAVVWAPKRRSWVEDIPLNLVFQEVKAFCEKR